MEEILKEIRELREIVVKQGEQIKYQNEEIKQCQMILKDVNLIKIRKAVNSLIK
ncbi:hypothetical protein [Clostridium sp.]|uniref:hypothetical protein n=1 Tax=Clostridium sp. TaxID=1506 RepID=UPI002842BE3A|nr:hypothetical protein [Clostridium sp.]MDR3595122.1 hypothetical protein [Clostridium sp.]